MTMGAHQDFCRTKDNSGRIDLTAVSGGHIVGGSHAGIMTITQFVILDYGYRHCGEGCRAIEERSLLW